MVNDALSMRKCKLIDEFIFFSAGYCVICSKIKNIFYESIIIISACYVDMRCVSSSNLCKNPVPIFLIKN